MAKGFSKAPQLSQIVAELALEEAERGVKIFSLGHIPGLSNSWPDSLSRLSAPDARVLPEQLAGVTRTPFPPTDGKLWIVLT